jgi:hypothetical protein
MLSKLTIAPLWTFYREQFEDTKGVIRRHKSKQDRQYNGQIKKNKKTNDDLQNTMQKITGWATRTHK